MRQRAGRPATYLYKFMLDASARGTGLGDALLNWACERAAGQGDRWLRLDCWRSNAALHDYYLRRGFRHVDTRTAPGRPFFVPSDSAPEWACEGSKPPAHALLSNPLIAQVRARVSESVSGVVSGFVSGVVSESVSGVVSESVSGVVSGFVSDHRRRSTSRPRMIHSTRSTRSSASTPSRTLSARSGTCPARVAPSSTCRTRYVTCVTRARRGDQVEPPLPLNTTFPQVRAVPRFWGQPAFPQVRG